MQNLIPNDGPGAKFGLWTPTVVTGTALVATYSATSGPDSTQGLTLSCTGTAATVDLVASLGVEQETMLGLSVILKASSASPTWVPFSVAYADALGNAVITHVPIASAAAIAAFTEFTALTAVPDGAVKATFTFGALTWASTGGYSVIVSSPTVMAF